LNPASQADPKQTGDLDLVAAVLRKDRKATARFVELCVDTVYSYVSRRLFPRRDLVDDMVQQVFLDAWDSLAQFRGQSSLRVWMLGIARHKVHDYYRGRLRILDSLSESAAMPAGFDEDLQTRAVSERVQAVLARLPEPYRAVLLWRYWEGMTTEEIARQSGRTTKAVERLLARAREQFRRCYGE
jgi:RNA polymerase sigma-70 factor (ECF subfamily)